MILKEKECVLSYIMHKTKEVQRYPSLCVRIGVAMICGYLRMQLGTSGSTNLATGKDLDKGSETF